LQHTICGVLVLCFYPDKEGVPINSKCRKKNENGRLKNESQIAGIMQT
jgi:hypothetical protein